MRFHIISAVLGALAAATTASAQSVVGSAYGFAKGVTGGGSGAAVVPSSAEELASLLADDTPRTVVINKNWDFTGTTSTGSGCDRKSCSASNGGQLYLGDLSCGGDDNVAVSSITYDAAGTQPLLVGSNKSIIGSGGNAVLNGKGIRVKKGASNVILQGFEITNLNPSIVWGGDAIDLQGNNDGVWIDHMKVSKIGRMFVVTHYEGSRLTVSNSEFDGVTSTSASCNGNHYWTMMFYGDGDQVTLDRNYFHDVAGRAPKLGTPGSQATFQASNNFFENMKGHAFDVVDGAKVLIEGNAFSSVTTPITKDSNSVSTVFNVNGASAASQCSSSLGRPCEVNSLSSSGDWPSLSGAGALSALANFKDFLVTPVPASQVASLVRGSAGPGGVGSGAQTPSPAPVETPEEAVEETTPTPATPVEEEEEEETVDGGQGSVDEDEGDEVNCGGQAVEEEATPTTPAPSPEQPTTPPPAAAAEASAWGQCGGQSWTGPTACPSGLVCVKQNDWYSQCLSGGAARKARSVRRRQWAA